MKKKIIVIAVLMASVFSVYASRSMGFFVLPYSVENLDSVSSSYGFGVKGDCYYSSPKNGWSWGLGGQVTIADYIFPNNNSKNSLNCNISGVAGVNFPETDAGYIGLRLGPGLYMNLYDGKFKMKVSGMTELTGVLHMYNGMSFATSLELSFAKDIFDFKTFFGIRKVF